MLELISDQGVDMVLVTQSAWLFSWKIDTGVSEALINSRVVFLGVFVSAQKRNLKTLGLSQPIKDGIVRLVFSQSSLSS